MTSQHNKMTIEKLKKKERESRELNVKQNANPRGEI